MPNGPKGENRPVDVIEAAVKVMKITTDEIEEELPEAGAGDGGRNDRPPLEDGRSCDDD